MPPIEFQDVVDAWQVAPVTAIHPLRHVSDEAYWESGVAQAVDAAQWIPDNGSVIDFGCGDGRLSIPLAQMGLSVIAMDASPDMLERVKDRAAVEEVKVATVLYDGLNLTKRVPQVDAIVCRAVLIHHNHDDVAKLVHSFSRLLKPGGYLICDWPTGPHYVRQNWTDVTTWLPQHRNKVAAENGFTLVHDVGASVWQLEYAH